MKNAALSIGVLVAALGFGAARADDGCAEAETEEKLPDYAAELETIRSEVRALALKFPVPGI